MSALYTVELHESRFGDHDEGEHLAERLAVFDLVLEQIPGNIPSLIVLPAGFIRVSSSMMERIALAELSIRMADREGACLVGVQLIDAELWAPIAADATHRLFLIERGISPVASGSPINTPCGASVPLVGRDIFDTAICARIRSPRPALILALSQSAMNERWQSALCRLAQVAPTFAIGALRRGRGGGELVPSASWPAAQTWSSPWGRLARYDPPSVARDSTPSVQEAMMSTF